MNWANYVGRTLFLIGLVGFLASVLIKLYDKINGGE